MRILIAEDDAVSRRVLEATFVKWQHDVVVAQDGDEALSILQSADAPPLAILDWMMPGLDGVEVCRRMRQLSTPTPSYLILLTAKTDKEDVVAGLEAGADDYLTKPFARAELRARIEVGARVIGLQKRLADRVEELNLALAERERSDKSLRASESRYRHLVEHSQGFICTHDFEGNVLSVNPAAALLLGYQPEEMVGVSLREFIAPSQRHLFPSYLERITQHETDSGLLQVVTSSGAERIWQYHNARYEEAGQEGYVLGHAQDITDLKLGEARLRNLSQTDELTGLHNPRAFFSLAEQHLKTALRDGKTFAIVYADMDGLKQINDNYGHQVGSQALKAVADILRNSFRSADLVARLGGDEFGILVADISAEDVRIPLAHLQEHLRRYNAAGLHDYELSLSVGVCCFDSDNDSSLEDLVSKADHAMYEDKKKRKAASRTRGRCEVPSLGEQHIIEPLPRSS